MYSRSRRKMISPHGRSKRWLGLPHISRLPTDFQDSGYYEKSNRHSICVEACEEPEPAHGEAPDKSEGRNDG
jgi:hypothetical protein